LKFFGSYDLAGVLNQHDQDLEWLFLKPYPKAVLVQFAGPKIHENCPYTCFTRLHVNRPLHDATEFDENLLSPDSRAPNPEEVVLQNDSGTLMRKALEKLPLNFREVFILREREEMSS
jgi:hypothetical protein